jgi:hypothetical protein
VFCFIPFLLHSQLIVRSCTRILIS